ncbi:unnamed protein product [Ixodes persulcatus]
MDLMARVANLCDTVAQRLVLADHGPQGQGPRPQVPVRCTRATTTGGPWPTSWPSWRPISLPREPRTSTSSRGFCPWRSRRAPRAGGALWPPSSPGKTFGRSFKMNFFHLGTTLESSKNWSAGPSTRTRPSSNMYG